MNAGRGEQRERVRCADCRFFRYAGNSIPMYEGDTGHGIFTCNHSSRFIKVFDPVEGWLKEDLWDFDYEKKNADGMCGDFMRKKSHKLTKQDVRRIRRDRRRKSRKRR